MNYLTGQKEQEAEKWFQETIKVASQALCLKAHCGTIIVQNDIIIGKGYNAPPQDQERNRQCLVEYKIPSGYKHDRTCCVHAEWRALVDALRHNPNKIAGSQMYFSRVGDHGNIIKSGKPYCTVCSRLALDVGVSEFILWHEEGICSYEAGEYNQLSYSCLT
jgi:deoxycytidylate deaminase